MKFIEDKSKHIASPFLTLNENICLYDFPNVFPSWNDLKLSLKLNQGTPRMNDVSLIRKHLGQEKYVHF